MDHGPEKRGDTQAAGWITKLDTLGKDGSTPTPDELWATVEWNTLGQQLVGERRYLYLSPSYEHDHSDENGVQHGTTMVGVGLTNRPFLSMATVSLSKAEPVVLAQEVQPDAVKDADSRGSMPPKLLEKLGLPADATEAQVLTALDALAAEPEPQKTLDQLAGAEGKVVLSIADHTSLAAQAANGQAAADELKATKFGNAFMIALDKGQLTPAQKDGLETLYALNPEVTLAAIAALPEGQVNVTRRSVTGEPETSTVALDASTASAQGESPVDDERMALHNRATALAAEKNLPYDQAVMLAAAEVS